ncbi:GNAT family N-acetyltransferase [Enterovibrio norvegicus]|uniref:GNAT family N-acetyltransferase n=1 Tax=Enterovibrio norvegicus TaxID=188144 RepID=UPI0024B2051F|nr:GNAT family N-acetyltransferase [Enterovibrio norvegicus]
MAVTLRTARQGDVDDIASIHVNSWKAAFTGRMPDNYIDSYTLQRRVAEWHQLLTSNTETVVVAELDSRVVGFLSFKMSQTHENAFELSKLYLCPTSYGKGVGSLLMHYFEKEVISHHVHQITLYVLDNNDAAIRFYTKHGFAFAEGAVSEEFEGEVIVDLLMIKHITT